ncbi:hypothetical protein NDU88_004488 [Pleurodeles waltl]|uniref:Uncharacterized protein n=1 Tax=Pleurodeles waltl TaxID=8319 RepID=A0AAV7VIW5_PLEWA|nr:hypothetical protein NDU88_004488 [Pleurodeles waltl]
MPLSVIGEDAIGHPEPNPPGNAIRIPGSSLPGGTKKNTETEWTLMRGDQNQDAHSSVIPGGTRLTRACAHL